MKPGWKILHIQLQTSVNTNCMSNYRPVSIPTAYPITDQCQYQLHVQLQTSVSTNCMSNYRPVSVLFECPITEQSQYQLHVQLQTRITACCVFQYRAVSLLTRTPSPLTEYYKIFEKFTYNGVSSFCNFNVAGEQSSFQNSVSVGGEGKAIRTLFSYMNKISFFCSY